jgi:transcription elongation factor GreA
VEKEPMTSKGFELLTAQLSEMKLTLRPAIVIALDEARQLGDLKENAEYHASKEELANMDKKIADTEDIVSRSVIIDPSILQHEKISFGSSIVLTDLATEEEINYTIVGSQESCPEDGLISFNSPLAKQLLGKEEGDEIKAKLPGGIKEFEVESVFYKG